MRTTSFHLITLVGAVGAALTGCWSEPARLSAAGLTAGHTADGQREAQRRYGPPVRVGDGRARAYVTYAKGSESTPTEVGVALDERALDGLPAPSAYHGGSASSNPHEHVDTRIYLLSLPVPGAAPYRFVELDWNPGGHEPPGIYDLPHFDFHFWTASRDERASIVPSDPQYQQKADMLPPDSQRPPFYAVAAPPGAPAPAVPLMGVHWVDVRSPELQQMFGDPEGWKPFTTTFLYGSWAGRIVFLEPMITRAYIQAKKSAMDPAVRDELLPISTQGQVGTPGYYPGAYRITWDAEAREYRIALTQLRRRQ